MSYEDDRQTLFFAAGVLMGGLLGAGVALLFAPQSGERTRRQIRHAAEDLEGRAGETLRHARKDARQMAEEARRAAERGGERLKETVEETVERGRTRLKV